MFEVLDGPLSLATIESYADLPIAFEVACVFEVTSGGAGAGIGGPFALVERTLGTPYVKDYDAVAGDAPTAWAGRFDLSRWRSFFARMEGRPVGAAAVAFDTPEVEMLEGRRDLALLWDIRVAPAARGRGVGAALVRAAERWALSKGCREWKVETQNINVPACRFYERMGCPLRTVNYGAYPDLPHEIQLLWYKDLPFAEGASRP